MYDVLLFEIFSIYICLIFYMFDMFVIRDLFVMFDMFDVSLDFDIFDNLHLYILDFSYLICLWLCVLYSFFSIVDILIFDICYVWYLVLFWYFCYFWYWCISVLVILICCYVCYVCYSCYYGYCDIYVIMCYFRYVY